MGLDKEIKIVIKNAMYLLVTQGITYLAPILVLGYLIKTLGVEGFGKYAIALAVVAYLQVLVDYGFSFSSSRDISQNRNDKSQVSRIYWSTTIIKIVSCILLYPILIVLLFFIVKDKELYKVIEYSYFMVLGNTILPIWFYQGIERLKVVAILNLIARVLSCVLVFIFVKNSSDIPIAILAQAIPVILCAILANLDIYQKRYIYWKMPTKDIYLTSIKNGWDIFVATLASVILSNSGVFVLGMLTNPTIVGAYAAAERIIKAMVSLFAPLTQSIYPYNCKKFAISIYEGIASVKRTAMPIVILAAIMALLVLFFSPLLAAFLKLPESASVVFKILSVWALCGIVNNIMGVQVLCASGQSKTYSRCFIIASITTILLLIFFIYKFNGIGAAMALTFGEAILTLLLILSVYKKFKVFNGKTIL